MPTYKKPASNDDNPSDVNLDIVIIAVYIDAGFDG